jgi:integration host factor subunit alpha
MEFAVESLETPALTKAQLADLLFEQIGLNKRESKDMIDAFFDLISAQPGGGQGRQDFRFWQLPDPHQGAAARAQPAHGESHPDRGARVVTFHASTSSRSRSRASAADRGVTDKRTRSAAAIPQRQALHARLS